MNPTVADINPKTLDGAKRQFVELYGSALVMNTYLKIAVVLLALVALGLVALNFRTMATYANVKPLVVRIDDVGRAEAVQYDATAYQPQPPELRYFLTQFVVKHFSRIRSTVQREYPDSLFFLEPTLADVSLPEIRNPPYKAAVTFQKLLYASGTRSERGHQTYVAQLDFVIRGHVPNEFVRVNPLGLQITYFRVDQAFEEAKQ